jgi:hypothetical protein
VLVIKVHVGKTLVDVVLLDGGYGVNIITKDLRNKLGLLILRSTPYNLVMVDQILAKLIGLIKNLKIHIHGISYIVIFMVMKKNVLDVIYSMVA